VVIWQEIGLESAWLAKVRDYSSTTRVLKVISPSDFRVHWFVNIVKGQETGSWQGRHEEICVSYGLQHCQ
jgi:hypothetical protein